MYSISAGMRIRGIYIDTGIASYTYILHIYPRLEIRRRAFMEVTSKSSVTGTNARPLFRRGIRISELSNVDTCNIAANHRYQKTQY
jgi:hypothetical protein